MPSTWRRTGPCGWTIRPSEGAVAAGDRVFDVSLQGERVVEGFDIIQEAGGPRRAMVREFGGAPVGQELTIALAPHGGDAGNGPVLCGVEVVVE